jgi:hypothetical membrane protein
MEYSDRTVAGALLFVGAVIFIIGLNVAEQLYPGYSVSLNSISDLGATCRGTTCHIVQPSATIFNSSIFLSGVLILSSAYFIRREFRTRVLPAFLALSGIGAIGVGIFPEYTGHLHLAAACIAFVFGGLSAIAAYTIEKPPLRYLSVLLGIVTLTAFVLGPFHDLGLGPGGMERMVAYPFLLWGLGFGGYLMQSCQKTS